MSILTLNRRSIFEATFIYKDSNGVPVNYTGLVGDAEFIIHDGDTILYTASVTGGEVTLTPEEGRFDLLIPEADINLLDFRRAEFQFRINWNDKGWQEIGDGTVIIDE